VAPPGRRLIAGYERLADLGELELELVRTGDYEGLGELHEERTELVATLPLRPPLEAQAALLQAAAFQAQTEGLLRGMVAIRQTELVRLERGRSALSAYAPAAVQPRRLDNSG
jgi:hypothetical protein